MTKEEMDRAPDSIRPVRIKVKFADGRETTFRGEAARAMLRWMINGEKAESKTG